MRKVIIMSCILLVAVMNSYSQKKAGTVFSEHEAIDKTRELWKAVVNGDEARFRSFFADSAIKTVVEQATYDSKTNSINLLVHTGIKTGSMVQYVHFWPALNDPTIEFPTEAEIELGYAGGYGPGQGVTGTINDCPGGTDD